MSARKQRVRGSIEERGDGFRVHVYASTDPITGKPHYLRETHGSYDEAEKARTRLQNQVDERHTAVTSLRHKWSINGWTWQVMRSPLGTATRT